MGFFNIFNANKKTIKENVEEINKVSYEIINEDSLKYKKKISVIVPVYNAENYLRKTIDSVVRQNIGFGHISLILVDDGSSDSSREILREYSSLYDNIVIVFLNKNTGTPAYPRNLGIQLANSEYITFLDADDWFTPFGMKSLYDLIEQDNVNYVVGKSIKVDNKGEKLIGKHESIRNRNRVTPVSIPHMFYHLGPRARMMNLDFIKNNDIQYPNMKYAEDKQFFIDVLTKCDFISTTTDTIYYVNREEANHSLTKQTDIMEKMDTNIAVLDYVLNKNLDETIEKMIVNRLVEFDSMGRLFDKNHFLKSKNKQNYYRKFDEVLTLLRKRKYKISETFFNSLHKIAFELMIEKKFKEVEKLYEWSLREKEKERLFENGIAYYITPIAEERFSKVEIPLYAELKKEITNEKDYTAEILALGRQSKNISRIQMFSREDASLTYSFNLEQKDENTYVLNISDSELKKIKKGVYSTYLIYNDYQRMTIRKFEELEYSKGKEGLTYTFYKTKNGNLALKAKKTKK
ncbi:glycosyltransferase [Alkalicoccobacillus murimartini]|uniref:Glycosyltransferase involved in cell wall biosynthesis n=1 Tax=Alkalicoccobacillus murimartini TaxID=171685 RepID=A0ABT9YHX2_9BACI|nr:glycosyltransferase [Alkalicoccobacillus murimartini]MDQ0206802.1 glycosyltransferase involved in cell wall biosynthesis [Alkalicoccobacillus murimartini]